MKKSKGSSLQIGWASRDVTPGRPVNLQGQFHMRISKGVKDPLTVTALALSAGRESAIFISCDAPYIPPEIYDRCRAAVQARVPEIDLKKIIINCTHTHTAPQITDNIFYPPVPPGVMTPEEYAVLFVARVGEAVAEAWKNRRPGGISFGLGTAVVGHNRRATYFDEVGARVKEQAPGRYASGYTKMYGNTDDPNFSHIEGYEDHYVDLMFTWNKARKLTGVIVNLACPSQETESDYCVSADFWHEIRTEIRKRHGKHIMVLPQCAPAGDQSPHLMWNKKAERRMLELRGHDMRYEIGRRVANAVDEVLPLVRKEIRATIPFRHIAQEVGLPRRLITAAEAAEVKKELARLEAEEKAAPVKNKLFAAIGRCKNALERYELQKKEPECKVDLHVLRLGDLAFATSVYELFLDFGLRIKARSPAVQNFLVQLAGKGQCCYLPTEKAVAGRGYGGGVYDNLIGPGGGQVLVEETVKALKELWPESK